MDVPFFIGAQLPVLFSLCKKGQRERCVPEYFAAGNDIITNSMNHEKMINIITTESEIIYES